MSEFLDRMRRDARLRRAGNRMGDAYARIAGNGLDDPADICPPSAREQAELEALLERNRERDARDLEAWAKQYGVSTEKSVGAGFAALSGPRRSAE